ncbi:hypothetical protein MB901379_03199 [Mycobacterium basiliense]|uniref:Uncharacterized protein n=1 Tax=Mycobacterium basiliense TaxID=2094119 RepID=A0A3S4BXJ3_9MYCO|nr:hypothetical protein MB901379_03199 [Mycobacterium basiliense]
MKPETELRDPAEQLDAAEELDRCIRRTADAAARNLNKLAGLLVEAKAGEIHAALGFESWPAYLANRLQPITKTLDRNEVRELIADLRKAGMSVRDISAATSVRRGLVLRSWRAGLSR